MDMDFELLSLENKDDNIVSPLAFDPSIPLSPPSVKGEEKTITDIDIEFEKYNYDLAEDEHFVWSKSNQGATS